MAFRVVFLHHSRGKNKFGFEESEGCFFFVFLKFLTSAGVSKGIKSLFTFRTPGCIYSIWLFVFSGGQ